MDTAPLAQAPRDPSAASSDPSESSKRPARQPWPSSGTPTPRRSATGRSSPLTAVNLAWHASAATRLGDSLFLLAGAPVGSSVVVPVLARLDLAAVVGEA